MKKMIGMSADSIESTIRKRGCKEVTPQLVKKRCDDLMKTMINNELGWPQLRAGLVCTTGSGKKQTNPGVSCGQSNLLLIIIFIRSSQLVVWLRCILLHVLPVESSDISTTSFIVGTAKNVKTWELNSVKTLRWNLSFLNQTNPICQNTHHTPLFESICH